MLWAEGKVLQVKEKKSHASKVIALPGLHQGNAKESCRNGQRCPRVVGRWPGDGLLVLLCPPFVGVFLSVYWMGALPASPALSRPEVTVQKGGMSPSVPPHVHLLVADLYHQNKKKQELLVLTARQEVWKQGRVRQHGRKKKKKEKRSMN